MLLDPVENATKPYREFLEQSIAKYEEAKRLFPRWVCSRAWAFSIRLTPIHINHFRFSSVLECQTNTNIFRRCSKTLCTRLYWRSSSFGHSNMNSPKISYAFYWICFPIPNIRWESIALGSVQCTVRVQRLFFHWNRDESVCVGCGVGMKSTSWWQMTVT